MLPVMSITGAAVNYSRALGTAQKLQAALDTATLAGAIIALPNREEQSIRANRTSMGTVMQNNTASDRSNFMDAKMLKACTNAKAAGVKIFTVGFSSDGSGISSDG